jgi:hypothetical protein
VLIHQVFHCLLHVGGPDTGANPALTMRHTEIQRPLWVIKVFESRVCTLPPLVQWEKWAAIKKHPPRFPWLEAVSTVLYSTVQYITIYTKKLGLASQVCVLQMVSRTPLPNSKAPKRPHQGNGQRPSIITNFRNTTQTKHKNLNNSYTVQRSMHIQYCTVLYSTVCTYCTVQYSVGTICGLAVPPK